MLYSHVNESRLTRKPKMFLEYCNLTYSFETVFPAYRVGSYAEVDLFEAGFFLLLFPGVHRNHPAQISRLCPSLAWITFDNTFLLACAGNNSNALIRLVRSVLYGALCYNKLTA